MLAANQKQQLSTQVETEEGTKVLLYTVTCHTPFNPDANQQAVHATPEARVELSIQDQNETAILWSVAMAIHFSQPLHALKELARHRQTT